MLYLNNTTDHIIALLLHFDLQGGPTDLVLVINLCALVKQKGRRIDVTENTGPMKRRHSKMVLRHDMVLPASLLGLDKFPNNFNFATLGCLDDVACYHDELSYLNVCVELPSVV